MALLKIILDNIIVPNNEEQQDPFEIDFKALEKSYSCVDLDYQDIAREVYSCLVHPWPGYFKIRDENEACTIKIETTNGSYLRIFRKFRTLYEELVHNNKMSISKNDCDAAEFHTVGKKAVEVSCIGSILMFDTGDDSIIESLKHVYLLGQEPARFNYDMAESPEVVELCNRVIPVAFDGVLGVNKFGGAKYAGGTIGRNLQGSGYNKVLDILKCVWLVRNTPSTVIMNYAWETSLHPVLKNWVWEQILKKTCDKQDKEGILICSKPLRL